MYKNDLFHIQQALFGLCDGLTKCVYVHVCVCVCVCVCMCVCMCVCKHFRSNTISSGVDPGFMRHGAYTTFGALYEK